MFYLHLLKKRFYFHLLKKNVLFTFIKKMFYFHLLKKYQKWLLFSKFKKTISKWKIICFFLSTFFNSSFIYFFKWINLSTKIFFTGFTGKDCDKVIILCDPNPCKNNAICLFEDFQPVCYCVPDYHGVLCELKYDDCAVKFAKCENGGTCIDGVNSFTCSCPAHYAGEMCTEYVSFNFSTIATEITENFSKSPTISTEVLQTTNISTLPENVITSPSTFIDSNEINFTSTDRSLITPIVKSGNTTVVTSRTTSFDSNFSSTVPSVSFWKINFLNKIQI